MCNLEEILRLYIRISLSAILEHRMTMAPLLNHRDKDTNRDKNLSSFTHLDHPSKDCYAWTQ